MYRYETHLHTVESSKCGVTPGREYPAIFKKRGYDGIFITDHFFHGNTRPDRDLPWPEYVDAYMKGYEEAKKAGDEIGFKVFFGIEENFEGDEYLIYGVGRDFLLAHPEIPHWTREEMTRWVHEAGGAVIQAHPFRDRFYISKIHLFPDGVEGIEGINTANTANDNLAALCYAEAHGMLITAGSDTPQPRSISPVSTIRQEWMLRIRSTAVSCMIRPSFRRRISLTVCCSRNVRRSSIRTHFSKVWRVCESSCRQRSAAAAAG